MVVSEMPGVVKLAVPVPPANGAPPVAVAYQSIVSPPATVAEMTIVPVPHRSNGPAPAVGAAGTGLTVAVTAARVADTQFVLVFLVSA